MPWAKLDDKFAMHIKVRPVSDAAFRLHVSAICWSAGQLTEGHIPAGWLAMVSDVKRPERAAPELVRQGMWHEPGHACPSVKCRPIAEGWLIHDYLDYHPSADKVRDERAATAERQRRAREKSKEVRNGVSNGVTVPVTTSVSNGSGHALVTVPPVPVPSSCSSVSRSSPETGRARENRDPNLDLATASLAACRRLRPDWTEVGLRRAFRDAAAKAGSQHRASTALLRVAAAPDSQAPRRVITDGWWWDDTDTRSADADAAVASHFEESA